MNIDRFFKFYKGEPCLKVGYGKTSYKMSRGAFKIKDSITSTCILTVKNIKADKDERIFLFSNEKEDISIEIKIREQENRLYFIIEKVIGNINRMWINLVSSKEEFLYGCGEHYTEFNLKGQRVRIWVAEHQNLKRILRKVIKKKIFRCRFNKPMDFNKYETYYAVPTFVSSNKYFVHIDSSLGMEFDFTQPNSSELFIRGIPKCVVIGYEDDFEKLIGNLTGLLGRQPILPQWVCSGMILGIQGGNDLVVKKLNKMVEGNVKVNAVWCQDWEGVRITSFGKQLMWNWEWDNTLYNNLPEFIKVLKNRNVGFMGYINPFLAVEGELYKYASRMGYTVRNKNNEDYLVKITTFPAAMVDLTNPQACEWIKDIIKTNMIDIGMCGWMADFGEYLPTDAVLFNGINAEEIHNKWPALWAKINYEAIEDMGKAGEIVFFTRAGYSGTSRYSPLIWNGDQHVDWSVDDGIASVIPASLSLSMSGIGYCHSDIGGYTTFSGIQRTKELLLRWAELGAFTPVMRSHEGNRPDDNTQFDYDAETTKHFERMTNIHIGLLPYYKHLINEYETKGLPLMRPLFMYYDEQDAYNEKYEYILGRDLLISPVLGQGIKSKEVYLPEDNWVHLWTGKQYTAGKYLIDCPIGYPPVFYRRDSEFFTPADLGINSTII